MATSNSRAGSLQGLQTLPPYATGKPYTISTQDGEIIYIPLSKSATRLLVTGKETEDAFAVVGSGGSQGDPIGFHYHREAHDVFLCLQGSVNIWADEKCRTLGEGDFVSVPPGTLHAYQLLGPHTEMLGLIVPGGWEEFFRFIGEPYSGPTWPMHDDRDFFSLMLPKLKAASEKFDMIPCPQRQHFAPQPWDGSESVLPGNLEPYYLKNATGPAWVVGGMVIRPLITTAESSGRFAIGGIEGSAQHHSHDLFGSDSLRIRFKDVHHAIHVASGKVQFEIEGCPPTILSAGELVYVPKGVNFTLRILSRVARMYVFCNGGGMVQLLRALGNRYGETVMPEKAEAWDPVKLASLQGQFGGFEVC